MSTRLAVKQQQQQQQHAAAAAAAAATVASSANSNKVLARVRLVHISSRSNRIVFYSRPGGLRVHQNVVVVVELRDQMTN